MRTSLAAFAFLVGAQLPAPVQGAEPSLQDQLLKESVAELAKAARERGDAGRGAVLFFQPFLTCAKCHDGDAGTQLGPDLAKAGKEATAEYLIESMLLPSKVIKKGYETVVVTTTDGRTADRPARRGDGRRAHAHRSRRERQADHHRRRRTSRSAPPASKSLMPDGLVNLLSDRQQFLDLAKYLIEIAEDGPARAKELRPAADRARAPRVREGHRPRRPDPRARRQGAPPRRGDLHPRLRQLPRHEGPARLAADLAAVRRRTLQERQRPATACTRR